ncbi:MAG: hypothetical protein ACOYXM_01705 [Actinomycetota bacterium]
MASVVAVSRTDNGIKVRLLRRAAPPFDWISDAATGAAVIAGREGEPLLDDVKAPKVITVSDSDFGKACKRLLDLITGRAVELPADDAVIDAFAEARITRRRSILGPDRFTWRPVAGVDQGPLVAATVALAALDHAKPAWIGIAYSYNNGRPADIFTVGGDQ